MEVGKTYHPASAEELRELIAAAGASGTAVEARGGGGKRAIGRPGRKTAVLDLSHLSGVIDYEPSELVLSVRPATPLADVEALLDAHGQMLAFEPWDHGALFGSTAKTATIGGVVAAGVAGPRRLSAGGARDHLLGFSAVSGRAEIFKAGGKVVKNVTGYDLAKVMAGSWGQLAVMTELAIKVVPKPKAVATVMLHGLDGRTAVERMAQAMGSVAGPVAAAHVPAGTGPSGSRRPAQTLLRLEGFAPSVEFRAQQLRALLGDPAAELIDGEASAPIWTDVREAHGLASAETLWRIHVAPSRSAALTEALEAAGAEWLMDWAGALVWAGAPAAVELAAILAKHEAHALLLRGPEEAMRTASLRPHRPGGASVLGERVKRAFDPAGILDPERFA